MGKTIEKLAIEQGHEILLRIDKDNVADLNKKGLKDIDVAIEFTNPDAAFGNVRICIENKVPVISGSTGWYDKMEALKILALKNKTGFFHTSNFSIGVNIFRIINKQLAQIMNQYPMYKIAIEEIHHTEKIDAPSGTAVMLANEIISNNNSKNKWVINTSDLNEEISIVSKREGNARGTHIIEYTSPIDKIIIKHEAFSRAGFALGAIKAAEFIVNKIGFYNMTDLISLKGKSDK